MLFDVHTHIGCDGGFYLRGWWPYGQTVQELIGHLDANGIDRAVCFPFTLPSAFDTEAFARDGRVQLRPGRVPFDRENDLLIQEVQRLDRDRRLLPLAMFDPSREIAAQAKKLETFPGRIAGLKTQSTIIQSPIRALLSEGRPLMDLARRHDWPVLFHTSINPADGWAQTMDCLDVAEAYPEVRFDLAHSLRFHLPSLKRAARLPNVWIDCSAHLIHCTLACQNLAAVAAGADRVDADFAKPVEVLRVIHEILGGRYLWGSDAPFQSWCDDTISSVFRYKQEADVLHALPAAVRSDMAETAPRAWLFGGKPTKDAKR